MNGNHRIENPSHELVARRKSLSSDSRKASSWLGSRSGDYVHPDRIFFEAFSQDQSVYAMVIANPGLFETERRVRTRDDER